MRQLLDFLADLSENNQREWFLANKSRFNEAKGYFVEFIGEIIEQLQLHDPRIFDLKPEDAVFRIYRDVRFSHNKTPYKTHFSAYLASGGRKSNNAGYYLHIGSHEKFLAAGVHSPAKEELHAIRQEILFRPETFEKILQEGMQNGYTTYEKDKLKKGPAGFPKDSPYIEYLKYKHLLLSHELSEKDVLSEDFSSMVATHFRKMVPFTGFLNTAMEFTGNA
jgi:uncharacterized protein (TIGR02453 family)